jgi:glycosyltransferase involved in cell wall biosynthesis
LTRFTHKFRVFFIEEPLFDADAPFLETELSKEKVYIIVPHLPPGMTDDEVVFTQQSLLRKMFTDFKVADYIAWYYTPMALDISEGLPCPSLVIYDCMDELSAFKNAPPNLSQKETLLLKQADLVFTGGYSLYEAKQKSHPSIYPFPSSIDKSHFSKARILETIPFDHLGIPHPRIGFFGVVDERFDIGLLRDVAAAKPEWQFVIIGPTVKIDPSTLPVAINIHYLGGKSYDDLPAYLSGWDVAMIPFARNESTQFISPTKTPEYLAGGIPVVSTSIRDVVKPYGDQGLVYIADEPNDFIKGIEWGLDKRNDPEWLKAVDDFLANISWDITWVEMMLLIQNKLETNKSPNTIQIRNEYV